MQNTFNVPSLVWGLGLLALQLLLAWAAGRLTLMQLAQRYPDDESLMPLLWHGGFLLNIPFTVWMSYLIARHGAGWTTEQWALALAVCVVATYIIFQYSYTTGTTHEAHVEPSRIEGERGMVTLTGWAYAIFFAWFLAVMMLYYLPMTTPNPPHWEMWFTTFCVIATLVVGNHFVLGWINPLEYHGHPLTSIPGWATILGVGIPLIVVTYLRVGPLFSLS